MRGRSVLAAVAVAALVPTLALAGGTKMSPVLSAKLSGKAEVPKGEEEGSGLAVLHLNAAKGSVCWSYTKLHDVKGPQASHIHKGAPGKAGPVVVPLGGAYKAKGCTTASKKLVEAIESHPSAYYVNIHNAEYKAGAVRGQLVVGMTG